MKKILGSIVLAGLPLLFAFATFTPAVASAHEGFKVIWHHVCNWHPFGNGEHRASIVVIKKTIDGNGTFQMTGDNGVGTFSITTHHRFGVKTLKKLNAGTYHITEAPTPGWTQVSNTCANVTVRARRTSYCVIVNKKEAVDVDPIPTDKGSLTVTKVTTQGSGDGTFSFSYGSGSSMVTTQNGTGSFMINNIPVGTFSVAEDESSGWSVVDSTCDNVTITKDTNATCTITNEKVKATGMLTIIKSVSGGTGSFTFSVTDSNSQSVALDPIEVNQDLSSGQEDVPDMPVGTFTISEVSQSGWTNGSITCVDKDGIATNQIKANETTTCSVINTKTSGTPAPQAAVNTNNNTGGGGGGSNGPPAGTWTFNFPQVLGASSTTLPELPPGCTALLSKYLRKGKPNDTEEVKKLQQFLNDELGLNLPVTGFFGSLTDKGVRQFQLMHKPQVLDPWGIGDPTGYVYKTTQRWINLSVCSSLIIPMPDLSS